MTEPRSTVDVLTSSLVLESLNPEQQYLAFLLESETRALLPMSQLAEVLKLPMSQIVPIPSLSTWGIGVCNWRGEILWLIDLACLLGLTPWYQHASWTTACTVLVLTMGSDIASSNTDGRMLGLVVSQVDNIERLNLDAVQPPPPTNTRTQLSSFLQGYQLRPDGELVAILDGEKLFDTVADL